MKIIHLVGTDHRFQRGIENSDISHADFEQFKSRLAEAMRSQNIRSVTEEMSPSGLHRPIDRFLYGTLPEHSVPHLAAKQEGLPYFDIDLPDEDRAQVAKDKVLAAKEAYWLERFRRFDVSNYPSLFILGADHVDTFAQKLDQAGFDVRVLERDWSPK